MHAWVRSRYLSEGRASGRAVKPDWDGQTVVCIASGPSLTEEDCARVKLSGLRTVVVNTSFRRAPWADILFAFDTKWWKVYGAEARATFPGMKLSGSPMAHKYGAESPNWFSLFTNSGASAASIALASGASKVVLIGYDASEEEGRKHWHDDHPAELGNCDSMDNWPYQFRLLAKQAQRRGAEVLNASRRTELTCFPRVELEAVL